MAKKYDNIMIPSKEITHETLAQKGEEGFMPITTITKRCAVNSRIVTAEYVIFMRAQSNGEGCSQEIKTENPKGKRGRPRKNRNNQANP